MAGTLEGEGVRAMRIKFLVLGSSFRVCGTKKKKLPRGLWPHKSHSNDSAALRLISVSKLSKRICCNPGISKEKTSSDRI